MTGRVPRRWSRFTHLLPYRRNNSLAGLRHAASTTQAIDLDVWAAGEVLVSTHWLRPLLADRFRDPRGAVSLRARVTDLTWGEIKRLRSPEGYRIRRVSRMLQLAARLGVTRVELDAKGGAWLTHPDAWAPMAQLSRELDVTVIVKCSSRRPRFCGRVLRAAHSAGLPTMLLPRGSRAMPRRWRPYIDYVRGPVIWR